MLRVSLSLVDSTLMGAATHPAWLYEKPEEDQRQVDGLYSGTEKTIKLGRPRRAVWSTLGAQAPLSVGAKYHSNSIKS